MKHTITFTILLFAIANNIFAQLDAIIAKPDYENRMEKAHRILNKSQFLWNENRFVKTGLNSNQKSYKQLATQQIDSITHQTYDSSNNRLLS